MSSYTQRPPSPPPPRDPNAPRHDVARQRLEAFWQRVSDGMKVNELWRQFQGDARSSYRLYSREINVEQSPDVPKGKHYFHLAVEFFWAVLDKLTPARRVLLLIALVLVLIPRGETTWQSAAGHTQIIAFDSRLVGGLLMFALLILEVTDRVVMKRDLQIAKEIQTWLLPAHPPVVPGLEIAFTTRPANTVAGDYYDVFSRPCDGSSTETFLLAVADVAGKSVPAAMLMATIQASLKTLCTTPGPLTELVRRMNVYACSNSQNGRRFTTAFIAEYDPASRRLVYVNAGHNAPMLRRQSGAIEMLEIGGLPLGVMDSAPYQSGTVTLQSGDWLVIYTDGVIEAQNIRNDEYGEARLTAMLHANASVSPAALLDRIMFDLDVFVDGAPQHDDVTLMLLRST
jgi:sigma-B regulation protein RsbU (phosphoserine phosphatase)